ncbi:S41 family peptidase [Opitutus terrae]|uniref:Peptidase S41 n=1 Tax=Opitutus terrae (strain DSM 11246 / JCM 15787 / PB90-1) TaxID=452637 RepID=B1ZXE2_OPITP|nr:S41 family peptidase [Opitutus terrae]ACB76937.1 peptidase S41 [Opitutus terrae PB90-1]
MSPRVLLSRVFSFRSLAAVTLGVAMLAPPLAALGPETVQFRAFALADLQRDFDQVQRLIETQHPQLYADRAAVQQALVDERAHLREGMNELEFYRLLAGVVRRLNCGHTALSLSSSTDTTLHAQRRLLPLAAKSIDGRLLVIRALPGLAVPVGAEITAINSHTATAVVQQLLDGLTADGANLTRKLHSLNRQFAQLYHLLVDTSSEFSITYLDPQTRLSHSVTLNGVSETDWNALRDPEPAGADDLGSSEFASDHAVLFVRTFNYYDAAGHTRFFAFIDNFFNEVAARRIQNVILDLRGNGGGDPYCGSYLFQRLIDRARSYFASTSPFYTDLRVPLAPAANAFTGSLAVLIDGGCFSTTGHFSSLLSYHRIGRFIGEETGGSFACTAANQSVTLVYTQLRFSYSTNTFTTAVSGLTPGRGIMPDLPVTPTAQDWISGNDPVKAVAQRLLRRGAAATAITRQPASLSAAAGAEAHFSLQTIPAALHAWELNGATLVNGDAAELVIDRVARSHAGIYSAFVTAEGQARYTHPAILGLLAQAKAEGGAEIGPDIVHPNGNVYDQVLLEDTSIVVTADPDQITRVSFVDLQDDIVQVEFAGAGTLTLTLDAASEAAPPRNYQQPDIRYRKGHARIVIAGADETTHLGVFSVGRRTALNPSLFRDDVSYDGWADLASVAILSSNGRFGGVRMGNAIFSGVRGHVGLIAPGVEFTGPVVFGDLHASEEALPTLLLGRVDRLQIAGGNLEQLNHRPVEVGGEFVLSLEAGTDSHNRPRTAQTLCARLEQDGVDVTPR